MTQPVDLDALLGVAGQVTLGGTVYDVLPMDGAGYRTMQLVTESKADPAKPDVLYDIVRRHVPAMDEATLFALRPKQARAILLVAAGQIQMVEQSDPNEKRPARRRMRPA